ncbi:hypothetical protein AT270_29070 [Bacillus cereus]|nr:hypothetical protein AT270_29070 [Bacillus cereus]
MPFASNRKYATTSISPFNTVPTIPNNQFFDAIAKIMPSNERITSMEITKVKFALGPLKIKKENMLARNIRHENPKNLYIIILP